MNTLAKRDQWRRDLLKTLAANKCRNPPNRRFRARFARS